MIPRIQEALRTIETEEEVTVIYASESGSRAWGFESADSDYDVRFIYARPIEAYLTIDDGPDVLERSLEEGPLDLVGWDLRKALRLLRKSNPSLLEWLASPIVYRCHDPLGDRLRALNTRCYSSSACFFHYLSMARGQYRDYLRDPDVRLKKYLYAFRAVLAARWILNGWGPVPVEMDRLVERLAPEAGVRAAVDRLIAEKKAGSELDRGPAIGELQRFLEEELAALTAAHPPDGVVEEQTATLNAFFADAVRKL